MNTRPTEVAILDLEQVAHLVDGGLLRTFTIDGESV